jgi:hypothetical protein
MNSVKNIFFFFITILCFGLSAFSQTATIKGFIKEAEGSEPVIFTSVYLKGTQYGAVTDVNGYYVISKIPPGSYILMVTNLGYDSINNPITLKSDDIIQENLTLKKSNIALKEVNVSAEKEELKTETKVSVAKITSKQISQIPSIGGQPDLAQYLQVLPGVISTGDQGGQLYIRGGSPIQNEVLLDGMVIYNPFHSIGLFSVFDTDVLKNADIYTGGFGAEYGDRISSVMDISTRDGNKKRMAGKVTASPFGAKMLIEGPLKRETQSGGGSSSFIFSAKNSYLKQSSKVFYKYMDTPSGLSPKEYLNYKDTAGLPYNYTDLYGKLSFNGANGNKINFFGFNYKDNVDYKDISTFDWNSWGAGTNFVLVPSTSSMLLQGNFAYSDYKIALDEANRNPRTSEISGFNAGINMTYFIGKSEAKWGIEMSGYKTTFDYFNSLNIDIANNANTTELAAFFKYKWVVGKFLIEPSFRMQYYASLQEMSPEPRISVKYNLSKNIRLKLAGGMYSQNLIAANSDQDVVNLFYGFISSPDNVQDSINGKTVKTKLQHSDHAILGVEFDPAKHITVNIEGYFKYFPQLTNLNENKIFDDNAANASKPDYLKKDFILETGNAEGADLSIKYEFKQLYIWAVYSLGYIHMNDGIESYIPFYDRRHNVNLVSTYTFGKNLEWETDVRWNLGSGFPFTQTGGYYENITFQGGINTNYTTANGNMGLLYGVKDGGRLPYYHRLDVSIKRHFILGQNTSLDAIFSITNVYNRKNIFYIDRITNAIVYQMPIMPSIGLNFTF